MIKQRAYPKVVSAKPGHFNVSLANMMEVGDKTVHVVERAQALVDSVHHVDGVLGELGAARLLVPRRQCVELAEQTEQVLMLLK